MGGRWWCSNVSISVYCVHIISLQSTVESHDIQMVIMIITPWIKTPITFQPVLANWSLWTHTSHITPHSQSSVHHHHRTSNAISDGQIEIINKISTKSNQINQEQKNLKFDTNSPFYKFSWCSGNWMLLVGGQSSVHNHGDELQTRIK